MKVDFRRNPPAPPTQHSDSWEPPSLRTWSGTITLTKAQQRLYFQGSSATGAADQFYSAIIESVQCSSITVWFGSATKTDIRRLQRTGRTAERIIGAPLPGLQELYTSRVRKRAKNSGPFTPSSLFELLPSGQRHRAPKQPDTRTVLTPRPYPTWTTHNTAVLYICK